MRTGPPWSPALHPWSVHGRQATTRNRPMSIRHCPCCRNEIFGGVDECQKCGFPFGTSKQVTRVLFRLALFVVTIGAAGYWMHYASASRSTLHFSAVAAAMNVTNDLCKGRITFPASKPGEWGIGTRLPLYVCAQVRGE